MSVSGILRPIAGELARVRDEVETQLSQIASDALPAFQSLTDSAVHHLFSVHGKYLRPSLVLLTARALADRYPSKPEPLLKVAAAAELVHSASLVHDDIIDTADERRGKASLNSLFGNKLAVLVGDLLYDQVFSLLTSLTDVGTDAQLALFDLFTTTTRKMCLGEIYEDQIVAEPGAVTYDDYLQVIDYKTASLMECCCRASAIVVGAADREAGLAAEFGMRLGRTYQLIDDVIDQDSVFFDRKRMMDQAVDEGSKGDEVLNQIGDNDGTGRLAEITQAVIGRVSESARSR